MEELTTDIVIIGGGIAGCIAAISLVEDFNVVLIDKLVEPKERIGESLAPAASRILRELDLLDAFESQFGSTFQQNMGMQSYWGSDQVHLVDHLRNPDGFVKSLNRKAFESFLRKSAEKRGVHCLWDTKLLGSARENKWKVEVKQGEDSARTISAAFVIDASGRQAHFARNLGIKRQVEDKLIACWMTIPNTRENTMSTISSSENGWWYSAVVPNNKRVIAFHTDADLVAKHELKSTESLLKIADENKQIKDLLTDQRDAIIFHGTVAANSTKLEQVVGDHWAALGDAAVSFDPLSSQGMFNAMASAMQLRDLIKRYQFGSELGEIYSNQINQIWTHYLNHKRTFYGAEMRWRDREFWGRRQ